MYCVPECRACVVAGSCPRGELPATAVSKPRRTAQARVVKAIAIEKRKATYLTLECGHVTDVQTQQVYDLWRPKGRGQARKYYCEVDPCHRWVVAKKISKPKPLPQQPLF